MKITGAQQDLLNTALNGYVTVTVIEKIVKYKSRNTGNMRYSRPLRKEVVIGVQELATARVLERKNFLNLVSVQEFCYPGVQYGVRKKTLYCFEVL